MLSLIAETANGWPSPPPAAIPSRLTVWTKASSSTVKPAIESSSGSSLTGSTVILNVLLIKSLSLAVSRSASAPPSSTVTVIRALPEASATGVNASEPVVSAEA